MPERGADHLGNDRVHEADATDESLSETEIVAWQGNPPS
jgi:hypothetical protein